jgi:hypothetical protein
MAYVIENFSVIRRSLGERSVTLPRIAERVIDTSWMNISRGQNVSISFLSILWGSTWGREPILSEMRKNSSSGLRSNFVWKDFGQAVLYRGIDRSGHTGRASFSTR